MSDEIIPWEVDTRITGLQQQIEDLKEENQLLKDTIDIITESRTTVREFNQRLMKELSRHGWGDERYMQWPEQDRNIVALLEEGGFQFGREQSTLETRLGSGRDDRIGTTGQETV